MGKTASKTEGDRLYLKYKESPGIVSERVITKDDFAGLGIEHDSVVFNRGNRFTVDATDFPEEVIQVFREDGGFTLSGSDAPPRLVGDTGADSGAQPGPQAGLGDTVSSTGAASTAGTASAGTGGSTTTTT